MTITCTVCGTVNPDGTTYCEGCGVELSAQTAAQPAAVPTPMPETLRAPAETMPADLIAAAAPVDGDLPALPESQTPDTPELAAGVPDLPLPDTSMTGTPEAAPAPAPVEEAAPVSDPAVVAAAMPAPAASDAAPTPAPSDAPAKLGIKKYGAPTGEFIPLHGERLVVGRFDASSGPVDIDLSGLGGQEHISRRHAELYRENGAWMVRDLGSTNGVYLKHAGESAFSPRLQEPAALSDGDEVAFGNLMLTFHQG